MLQQHFCHHYIAQTARRFAPTSAIAVCRACWCTSAHLENNANILLHTFGLL